MEESGAMVAKRVWSMVRALYFMLRKDKSHKKFMVDIKMMMKRGKLARKAIVEYSQQHLSSNANLPGEYIFSCSDTPLFRLHSTRNGSTSRRFFSCAHATPTVEDGDEMMSAVVRIPDSPYPMAQVHEEDSCVDEAAEEFIRKFYKDLKKQA